MIGKNVVADFSQVFDPVIDRRLMFIPWRP